MRTTLYSLFGAAVLLVSAAVTAPAQPQATPPKDPGTPLPSFTLESLWQEIDCECACDCCERIKQLIRKRLKDPRGRPQPAPSSSEGASKAKPKRQRDMERRRARIRHPEGTGDMWDRPWPSSGDRWLDAARHQRYRESRRHARAERHALRSRRELTDGQREAIAALRHRSELERIDLEAALEKEKLELQRVLRRGDPDRETLRRQVDAVAQRRADLEFHRLMTRIETRRIVDDREQRGKRR